MFLPIVSSMILSSIYVLQIVFLCQISHIMFIKVEGQFVLCQFGFHLDVLVKKIFLSETSTLCLQMSRNPNSRCVLFGL